MRIIICFLIVLEILCQNFLKDYWEDFSSTWIYIFAGLAIALLPILINKTDNTTSRTKADLASFRIPIILLMVLAVFHHSKKILSSVNIDYRMADMLPVIDKMSLRYLQGDPVYSIIPEIWGGMQPIYLPAMWIPFSMSHILDIDMRWISIIAILGGCALMILALKKQCLSSLNLVTVGIPIVLIWTMITTYDHTLISISQEGVVIGYYLLLSYALIVRNWWLVGLSIGLCLMSRYSLAPWGLGLGVILLFSKNYKVIKQVSIGALVTSILLIISTGTLPHLNMIFGMPKHYLTSVQADPSKYLSTIEINLGLAKFFSFENLGVLHNMQLWLSISLPLLVFGLYQYRKPKTPFNLSLIHI